jgi:hypothetical protein
MNWQEVLFKTLPTVFEVVAAGLIFVLHQTGADRHKTIAGDIAAGLEKTARVATAVHRELMDGAHQDPAGGGA